MKGGIAVRGCHHFACPGVMAIEAAGVAENRMKIA